MQSQERCGIRTFLSICHSRQVFSFWKLGPDNIC